MKKIISLVLALAMIFSLCAINFTASAYDGPSVYVYYYDETDVTHQGVYQWDKNGWHTSKPDGVTVALSGSDVNITLENAEFLGMNVSGCDSVNVTFKGENKIGLGFEGSFGVGIFARYCDMNITFADDSNTTIGTCTDKSQASAYSLEHGVATMNGDLNVVGSSSANVDIYASVAGIGAGIQYTSGDLSTLDLSGFKGTMNIYDFGEVYNCSLNASGDIIIDGGTYNLDSYSHYNLLAGYSYNDGYDDVYKYGDITIKNATINAKAGYENIAANKVSLSNSKIDMTATVSIETNDLVIDDSNCNITGTIKLGINNCDRTTFNMNSGSLIVAAKIYPAIYAEEIPADVNINGGFTKLTVDEGVCTIGLVFDTDAETPSTINYSKVGLYEETDGQKVCTGEHEGTSIVALGYDGFSFGTRVANGAKVSTFGKPSYTAGEEQEVAAGKDATFKIDLTKEYLTGVYVDGKLVDSANYTVVEGSTILTLKVSFLETLEAGEHTLSVRYNVLGTDMKADTTFTITDTTPLDDGEDPAEDPATGDATVVAPFVVMAICSAAGAVVLKKKEF